MTHTVRMDIQQSAALMTAADRMPEIYIDEMTGATWEAELLIERDVKELTPTGIGGGGGLKGSISSREPVVLANNVIGEIGTPLNYAVPVELGSKPHMPPIQPLADWAEHVLGVSNNEAWRVGTAIAFKIKARGTEGAFMFERAFKANEKQVQRIYGRAAQRIIDRVEGSA